MPILAAAVVLFFVTAGLLHALLGQQSAYDIVKGMLKTYAVERHDDGSWNARNVEEPYEKVTNDKMIMWDAAHYNSIKEYLYRSPYDPKGKDYAFFPLFPLLWRTTGLPPLGICLLNILLFAIGATLLASLFRNKMPAWMFLLALCMPYLVIFAIPYSEALFFITTATGLYGLIKRRYWIFFLGFLLASMTRSASNILLVAWLITNLLLCLRHRETWKSFFRNVALHLAPVATGVLAVIIIQHLRGAGSPFQFVSAQGLWGKELSLPSWPFTDWSVEGKSVTWPLIFTLFIPALAWLATKLFSALRHNEVNETTETSREWQTARILSVLFFVGNIVLALFTQKGCMYSQARLLTCTSFFFFLLFDCASQPVPKVWRWVIATFLMVSAVYCHTMLLGTSTLGCIITLLLISMVFFHHWMKPWLRYTLVGILLLLNIFWTAYLFNCFLNGGWIFT